MTDPSALRWFGRTAGLMFIGGALLPVPSTLLLDPQPPAASYALTALVVLTGLACLALPWDRASLGWLHAVAVIAALQVACTVALFDPIFSVLYFVVAVLVAYGFGHPRIVLPHMLLISALVLAPIAYEPAAAREGLRLSLLVLPSLWMLAGGLVFLRSQVETREREYRRFAEQAISLSERISGRPVYRPGTVQPARSLAEREPAPAPTRWWRPAAGLAAAVLAVPFGFVGLASAGVSLPGVVVEPFERLGIELPNQGGAAAPEAADVESNRGERARTDARRAPDGDGGRDRGPRPDAGPVAATPGSESTGPAADAPAPQSAPVPTPAPSAPVPASEPDPTAGSGGGEPTGSLDGLLDGALDEVRSVLDAPILEQPQN